ncbi:MAG: OB-fold domain-containing protein [Rhodobiaceae bacterium]|nr:OB-fold domain-containing protein [Rhodobiaceae bacterium]
MNMDIDASKIPSPGVEPDTAEFWAAANDGVLKIGSCNSCGEPHFYPRAICPRCGSLDVGLKEAKGTGTIYTYSVFRRTSEPYALAWVSLDEGVGMMTNIINCDLDEIRIGQEVEVVFRPSESGQAVPMFQPRGGR